MVRAACFERTRVTKILPTPVTICIRAVKPYGRIGYRVRVCLALEGSCAMPHSDFGLHKYHKTLLYNSTLQSLYREARWPLASGRLRPSGGA